MTERRRPSERERIRRAAEMIPGAGLVTAADRLAERAENERRNRRRVVDPAERERMRALRLGADRRLRGRDGDFK